MLPRASALASALFAFAFPAVASADVVALECPSGLSCKIDMVALRATCHEELGRVTGTQQNQHDLAMSSRRISVSDDYIRWQYTEGMFDAPGKVSVYLLLDRRTLQFFKTIKYSSGEIFSYNDLAKCEILKKQL